MSSKIHFWSLVAVRAIRLLLSSDKSISLRRTRSSEGVTTCQWENALWIELSSGERILNKKLVVGNQMDEASDSRVIVQGFCKEQTYSMLALLLNESLTIQPFRCVINAAEIVFPREQKVADVRPIEISARIQFVNLKSIEIKHNAFSKITLP